MVYADTDFFLALLKEEDWLKDRAERVYKRYKGRIWTSFATMTELLLVSVRFGIDPERLLVSALEIAQLRNGEANTSLLAAHYMKEHDIGVFDSLHAAACGREDEIVSSDRVFDKIGLDRIRLEEA